MHEVHSICDCFAILLFLRKIFFECSEYVWLDPCRFLASQLVLFFGSATIEERICPERNASVCNVLLTSTVSLRSIFLLLTTSTHRILRPLCRSLVSALYERSRGLTSSGRAWALPRVKLSSCHAIFPRSLVSIDFSKCTRC